MNERLQKTALTFSHSMTSQVRRAAKSDLKALCEYALSAICLRKKGILLVCSLKFA